MAERTGSTACLGFFDYRAGLAWASILSPRGRLGDHRKNQVLPAVDNLGANLIF
jgi:hypothetical protein